MISVEMTVAEMVKLCGNVSVDHALRDRIIAALEKAVESTSANGENYRFNLLSYNPERKIPVIKALRMVFNWSLREAKDWVENADPDAMTWSTTPWMEYNKAFDLNNALRDLGCACGPIMKESPQS